MRAIACLGLLLASACLKPNLLHGEGEGATDGTPDPSASTGAPSSTDGDVSSGGQSGGGSSGDGSTGTSPACTNPPCFGPRTCHPMQSMPFRVTTGDVDGNGHPDVLLLSQKEPVIEIWRARDDGTLAFSSAEPLDDDPISISSIDADADDIDEIAVGIVSTRSVVIFDAVEASRSSFSSGGLAPLALQSADANADGVGDLAIALGQPNGDGTGDVRWALGRGDGTFEQAAMESSEASPIDLDIALVDDEDSTPDVLVLMEGERELAAFITQDEAQFADDIGSPIGRTAHSIDSADIDGDGIVDVLTASAPPAMLDILQRDSEQFTYSISASISLQGVEPGHARLADLDLDGVPDVVVAMRGAAEVRVFRGSTTLTFGDPDVLALPDLADALVIDDLNQDGRPDIVVTVPDSPEFCVFMGE